MPFVDASPGVRLHFADRGAGRPVVLVHGWSLSHRAFGPQLEALSRRLRVVAVDLRGHGASTVAPGAGGFEVQDFARDLGVVFEHADLRDAVLVGWSWGAQVALAAVAAEGPVRERVAALALLSATPRFTTGPDWPGGLPEARVRALRARYGRDPDETRRRFFAGMFADGELGDGELARHASEQLEVAPDAAAARATLDALASTDLRDAVARTPPLPTLLVHGDRDAVCLPAASAWLADRLPRARRVALAGAGHAPQLSRADAADALLLELCEGVA